MEPAITPELAALARGEHGDPFALLGMHAGEAGVVVRTLQPQAASVRVIDRKTGRAVAELPRIGDYGLFGGPVGRRRRFAYRLRLAEDGGVREIDDPYAFGLLFGEVDAHLFAEGNHLELYNRLGAQSRTSTGSTASPSACGRRAPRGSASSAISTAGTAAAIPCASARSAGSGSCSSRGWPPARSTSSRSRGPAANCCPRRRIRWPFRPSCGRVRRRSCTVRSTATGPTRHGSPGAAKPMRARRRSRPEPRLAPARRPGPYGGVHRLVRDLNHLYRAQPALHQLDCEGHGFEWIEASDNDNSVLAFMRKGHDGTAPAIAVSNFTPIPRHDYRVGVPSAGVYRELLKLGIHFALVMSICWDGEPGIPSRRRGRLPAHPD